MDARRHATDAPRRSPVHRLCAAAGASFAPCGDAMLAVDYGAPEAERDAARRLGLCDLSVLPRAGFKGAGTRDWLASRDVTLPAAPNLAARQPDGALAAALGPEEILVLTDIAGRSTLAERLHEAWHSGAGGGRGYPVPRRDTHAWFRVSGERAAAMFAKLAAVDLRPRKFAAGRVAQTSIARSAGIVIRNDGGAVPTYELLVEWAMADYYVPVLLDAMAEFDGRLVGQHALVAMEEGAG